MARASGRTRRRSRGAIDLLPSGALRVRVYAGTDPVTGRRHDLIEVIPPGPQAEAMAERARVRLLNQVDERRNPRTKATIAQLMERHLEMLRVSPSTHAGYRAYVDRHINPLIGHVKVGALDGDVLDSFYAELNKCQDHCGGELRTEHRTRRSHTCDERCVPHVCRPLSDSTLRQIHYLLSKAFKRAVRWRWVNVNPFDHADPPRPPTPEPSPPSVADAARIINEAWRDPDWGAFVWLAITTGARRGELCALQWEYVDLDRGVLTLRRSVARDGKGGWYVKDTKTHQQRRVALDPSTVVVLAEHRGRAEVRAAAVGATIEPPAFVFSLAADQSEFRVPGAVSQRYSKMAARLGVDTHLHALRHYSATELLAAGVDVRTVAGRLGHSGGGTTTLRFYSAWRHEADQRAAQNLGMHLPQRQASTAQELADFEPSAPYQEVAVKLRDRILGGEFPPGLPIPSMKHLADEFGVGVSTARKAVHLLGEWGLVDVATGRPTRVRAFQSRESAQASKPLAVSSTVPPNEAERAPVRDEREWLALEVRRLGATVARLDAHVDPADGVELKRLLVDAVKRDGQSPSTIGEYELVVRRAGEDVALRTFVAAGP
jgi:integrase